MKIASLPVMLCLSAVLLAGGCKDKNTAISSFDEVLKKQHKYWNDCADAARKGTPKLNVISVLGGYLGGRTRIMMEKEYTKPNKAEAVGLLKELDKEYRENVLGLLDVTDRDIRIKAGVTNEDVCKAFLAMDDRYQKLVDMTK